MSPSRTTRDAILAYVRRMADELGLRDWTIIVDWNACPLVGETAQVEVTYGRKVATVYLGDEFWTESRQDQRQTIVHELIHCHIDDIGRVARDMGQQLGTFASSMFEDNHHHAIEKATDAIAEAIAGRFPLPRRRWARD